MKYVKKKNIMLLIVTIILFLVVGFQIYKKYFIPEFEIRNHILVSYNGVDETVEVPEGVVIIDRGAFINNDKIKKVILPDGVKAINHSAFRNCPNLEEIVFPEGLENFRGFSLDNNLAIKRLYLQEGVTGKIDLNLNAELEELKIPSTATIDWKNILTKYLSITERETILKTLILPPYVDQNNLEKVLEQLPRKDQLIIYGYEGSVAETVAFDYQIKFESIGSLRKEDDFILADDILVQYIGTDSKVVIPDGVRVIGSEAFWGQKQIQEIIMPNSVEYLGDSAFAGSDLKYISFSKNLKTIGNENLMYQNIKELRIPPEITYIGSEYLESLVLEDLYLPKGIKYIDEQAFFGTKPNVTIYACNSYVKKYAKKYGFKYVEEDWEEEYYKE